MEGILLRNGEPVPGRWGQILDTPKGRFMYFTNPAEPAYLKGWLNKLTYEAPVFGEDGTLTEIFWKTTEAMPLTLHEPTGEAPALLREIDSWEHKSIMYFEAGDRFEYLSFKDELATKWSKKVYNIWAQRKFNKKRDVRYPPQTYVFQAWATVLNIGDWYVSYQLDTKKKTLVIPAMVSVGENKWYYVDGSPFTLEEILFEFDADPISVKEGKVTITRPWHKVKPKVTVPFRVIHSPRVRGRDYETWGISIEEPHCQYYMRYQRFDTGLTYFVPSGRPEIFRPASVQLVLDVPAQAEPAAISPAPAPAGRDDE